MKADSHTHSKFSPDGSVDIDIMAKNAIERGAEYLAITDHCDKDVLQEGNKILVEPWPQLDLNAYYEDYKNQTKKFEDFYLAFGIEAGFDKRANYLYQEIIEKYPFDVVINSVHFIEGYDGYFADYYLSRTKDVAYKTYLDKIYESLLVNYSYNIVGHIGYCVRNAPYEDRDLHYDDAPEHIDAICKKIIELGKVMEVNSHVDLLTPNAEIVQRYFELGGRKISFGSDAHKGDVLKDYDKTIKMLKNVGFEYLTIFKKQEEKRILI